MQRELFEEEPHLNGVLGPQWDALFIDLLMRMHDLIVEMEQHFNR